MAKKLKKERMFLRGGGGVLLGGVLSREDEDYEDKKMTGSAERRKKRKRACLTGDKKEFCPWGQGRKNSFFKEKDTGPLGPQKERTCPSRMEGKKRSFLEQNRYERRGTRCGKLDEIPGKRPAREKGCVEEKERGTSYTASSKSPAPI